MTTTPMQLLELAEGYQKAYPTFHPQSLAAYLHANLPTECPSCLRLQEDNDRLRHTANNALQIAFLARDVLARVAEDRDRYRTALVAAV